MRIETIVTVERLHEIEVDWNTLYKSDPNAQFYLSARFVTSAAMHARDRFRVLTAWSEDGQCLGILPLVITIRWSKKHKCLYNVLDMLGHVFDADYTGILSHPEHETEVCEAFAQSVSRMAFGRIILNYFSGPKERLKTFVDAFDRAVFETRENTHVINDGQTNNLICPYIDLPDTYDAYLATLTANTRQKIRRLERKQAEDPTLKITRSWPQTYAEDVKILADLWYQKHVGGKGERRAARLANQFKEVVMLGLADGTVYLALLWRGDAAVAAQANYVDLVKREMLFHVSGRDESVKDISVGLLLQAHCIRWAISNGLQRYDFTIGNEPYKYSLGATDRTLASAEISSRAGGNISGVLDIGFREDTLKIIQQFSNQGRSEDARTAARQAIEAWPDLEPSGSADGLISTVAAQKGST